MRLVVCVAKVEGYLGQGKDYERVCARIRGELQNGRKCWEAFGLVWGPLKCVWGLDSRKRHLGISFELSCSQYLPSATPAWGQGCTEDYFTSLQNRPLCVLLLWRADAMGSGSVTEAVRQKGGIFLLQKSRQVIQTPLSCPCQHTLQHYPVMNIMQLSWGLYKVAGLKKILLQSLCSLTFLPLLYGSTSNEQYQVPPPKHLGLTF